MKKIILLLMLSPIFIANTFAQSSIWKVEGKGNTIYIGGTIHVLRPSDYPLPKEFDMAYKKSDIVVFEADLGKFEEPAVAQSLMMRAMYTGETTIKSVLNKKVYKALKEECAKNHLPLAQMGKFKPSMIILTLTMMKLKKMGITSSGVDKNYFDKAKKDKQKSQFLETVESQINLIANMGAGNENEFVLNSLQDFDNMEKDLKDLISDWKKGTNKIMLAQLTKMKKDFPKLYKSLLVERNNAWMPKLETYLGTKPVEYILVGSLHLHGPDGILTKLKQKGYKVTQL